MTSDGGLAGRTREGTGAASEEVEHIGGKSEERLPQTGEGTIFISYRVTPDEPIAAALKEFLESCLNPKPSVFVSGLGGIVPSEHSSKAQIQRAAQKADAFIAIITKSSRDREWIFFEAGAAWVRNVLYAPLLAGVDFDGLPNSINSYQAIEYAKEEKVVELLREVAARTRSQVRPRAISSRYTTFKAAIATALGERLPSDDDERKHDISYAFELIFENTLAAEAKLDKFAPDDPGLHDRVALLRIDLNNKLSNLEKLSQIQANSKLKTCEGYAYLCALYESSPHRALEYALEALEALKSPDANAHYYVASLEIALAHLKSLGREDEGLMLLRNALGDRRRLVRADAAMRLAQHLSTASKLVRAALAAFAASEHTEDGTLLAAARMLYESGPIPLFMHVAHLADMQEKSAIAQLHLGLAYSAAGFKSLAYSKYKTAAASNVAVAKANIAQLFAHGSVAGAGLDVLQEHEGPFDASSPGFPYSMRGELEEAVHAERNDAEAVLEAGRASLAILAQVIDTNARTAVPVRLSVGEYASNQGKQYAATLNADRLVKLNAVAPTEPILSWEYDALPGLIFAQQPITNLSGIVVPRSPDRFTIYWFGVSGAPQCDEFERVPESVQGKRITSPPDVESNQ
jgi:TIR domain